MIGEEVGYLLLGALKCLTLLIEVVGRLLIRVISFFPLEIFEFVGECLIRVFSSEKTQGLVKEQEKENDGK